jgi:hypothetical protein
MSDGEVRAAKENEAMTGGRPTWEMKAGKFSREAAAFASKMGTANTKGAGSWQDSFGLFGRRTREQTGPEGQDGLRLGKLERAALADLDLDARTDKAGIKARYHEMLKRFHPDTNGGDRTAEVRAAQELLQTMGIRSFVPIVAACPGCGRTTSTVFQELARDVQNMIRDRMPEWKTRYPGVETLNLAVMGCIVNGPGESKHADIGISLPGTGEQPSAPVFIDGQKAMTLRGPNIADEFKVIVEQYIEKRYGAGA